MNPLKSNNSNKQMDDDGQNVTAVDVEAINAFAKAASTEVVDNASVTPAVDVSNNDSAAAVTNQPAESGCFKEANCHSCVVM